MALHARVGAIAQLTVALINTVIADSKALPGPRADSFAGASRMAFSSSFTEVVPYSFMRPVSILITPDIVYDVQRAMHS